MAVSTREKKAERTPPDGFICPITMSVMSDPAMTVDGHSYERKAIERWLQTHDTSPLTGSRLPSTYLTPNHALRKSIEEWKANIPEAKIVQNPQAANSVSSSVPVSSRPQPSPRPHERSVNPPRELKRIQSELDRLLRVLDAPPAGGLDGVRREIANVDRSLVTVIRRLNPEFKENSLLNRQMTQDEKNQAFLLAVEDRDVEAMTQLSMVEGANKEAKHPQTGATALIIATQNRDMDMLRSLCEILKVDVNAKDNAGDSALFYAIQNRDKNSAKLLLRYGAFEHTHQHEGITLNQWGKANFRHWDRWLRPSAPSPATPRDQGIVNQSDAGGPVSQHPATLSWIASLRRTC